MLTVTVAKWGNSIGIRLPKEVAISGQISIGDNLHIEATEDVITLKKVKTIKKYDLADLLSGMEDYPKEDIVDWGSPVGREVW